jgi:hypothetical protein
VLIQEVILKVIPFEDTQATLAAVSISAAGSPDGMESRSQSIKKSTPQMDRSSTELRMVANDVITPFPPLGTCTRVGNLFLMMLGTDNPRVELI